MISVDIILTLQIVCRFKNVNILDFLTVIICDTNILISEISRCSLKCPINQLYIGQSFNRRTLTVNIGPMGRGGEQVETGNVLSLEPPS